MAQQNKLQHSQVQQQEEQISEELLKKFDGDRELVMKFVENGYSTEQLTESIITHPTYSDPVVTLRDSGKVAGFWL